MAKRPTIIDIATRVGVSKAAVSYALNGRNGVSAETRERILDVAAEMGWHPSNVARALSSDRTASIGFVFARSPEVLRTEPYFMQLLAGMEQTFSEHGVSLQLALARDQETELATYQRWWAERRVDGVVLTDLRVDDPRPPLLRELAVPTVLFGAPGSVSGMSVLRSDDRATARQAVDHLVHLGHRTIGHVQGPSNLQHTRRRGQALRKAAWDAAEIDVMVIAGGNTEQGGLLATQELLAANPRPSAIIYDNDVMAVAAVANAGSLGVRVPEDLAALAWNDSMLCRVVHPSVTAFAQDVVADGSIAAQLMLELVETGNFEEIPLSGRQLVPRMSTELG